MRKLLADRLMFSLSLVETEDWVWFEEGLAYDNARLAQALIVTGISMGEPTYIEAGLKSLRWLMTLQTAPAGCFRPVGTRVSAKGASNRGLSTSNRSKPLPRYPLAPPRGGPKEMSHGKNTFRGYSAGSRETMTWVSLWWMQRQAVAAMACIPIAPTKTVVANPSCAIYSASLKSGSSRA